MSLATMMQNSVCSLERAQKLKYLGVKQESIHCYYKSAYIQAGAGNSNEVIDGITLTYQLKPHTNKCPAWCAYMASELGEILPGRLTVTGIKDEDGNSMEDMVFRLREEKCIICPNAESEPLVFEEHWALNYVDEYGIGNDLIVNKLFPHNVHNVKEADARAQLLIQLIEAGFFLKVA